MSPMSGNPFGSNPQFHPQTFPTPFIPRSPAEAVGGGGASRSHPPKIEDFLGLGNQDLVARFGIGVEVFDRRVVELTDSQIDTAFLPEAGVGRWPVRVLLGHLADAELVFVHRMRRAVAEDNPLLAVFDEQAFIDAGLYGSAPATGGAGGPGGTQRANAKPSIGAFIATIHTLRRWTTDWLGGLTSTQWERGALHPERGPLTVRRIVEYDTWHLENHSWYLNRKISRFLGERSPEPAKGS